MDEWIILHSSNSKISRDTILNISGYKIIDITINNDDFKKFEASSLDRPRSFPCLINTITKEYFYGFTTQEELSNMLDQRNFEISNNEYIKNRKNSYKTIEEQLDMIYWDKVNNTSIWEDHITQVKTDNPKS